MDPEVIERDQYDKIGELTEDVKELSGSVDQMSKYIEQLIGLLRTALMYMFWIIVILIGAVIYGAVGERGFNSVADRLPVPVTRAVIPWQHGGDLSRWS